MPYIGLRSTPSIINQILNSFDCPIKEQYQNFSCIIKIITDQAKHKALKLINVIKALNSIPEE